MNSLIIAVEHELQSARALHQSRDLAAAWVTLERARVPINEPMPIANDLLQILDAAARASRQ